jgi:hypothetical protein
MTAARPLVERPVTPEGHSPPTRRRLARATSETSTIGGRLDGGPDDLDRVGDELQELAPAVRPGGFASPPSRCAPGLVFRSSDDLGDTARRFEHEVMLDAVDEHAGAVDGGEVEINIATGEVRDPSATRIRLPPETREAMMASAAADVVVL